MSAHAPAAPQWNTFIIARLRDSTLCPVCSQAALTGSACSRCGADVGTPEGSALWVASQAAADALQHREHLRTLVPRTPAPGTAVPGVAVSGAAVSGAPVPRTPGRLAPVTAGTPARATAQGNTSVQSLLAVAGAGLFAIAAVVFTFFNPDLTDHSARSAVTLAVTALFLSGSWWLGRRGLRASAEAVGALGMVFVALDVYAVAGWAPAGVSAWTFAAIGAAVAGTTTLALGVRLRLRAWSAVAFLGLALVPAMLGASSPQPVSLVSGWLTTMAAALALIHLTRRVEPAVRRTLRAERRALTAVQLCAVAAAAANTVSSALDVATPTLWLGALAAGAVAVVARLSSRRLLPTIWSLAAGAAAAAATCLAVLAATERLPLSEAAAPALLAGGPLLGFLVVTLVGAPRSRRRRGAMTVGAFAVVAMPTLAALGAAARTVLAMTILGHFGGSLSSTESVYANATPAALPDAIGVAVALALVAGGLAVHARVLSARAGHPAWSAVVAAWVCGFLLVLLAALPFTSPTVTVLVGVGVSGVTAVVVWMRRRHLRPVVGVPLLLGAHAALVMATVVAWRDPALAVATACGVLASLTALAFTVPARARWAHAGVGYAYALVALGTTLTLIGLSEVAALSLTTSAGAVVAIAATFTRSVSSRIWWAVLVVTAGPFLLGILQVVRERSGWTALSTGLIFLLALTLLLSRRPGLGPVLRAACAAILVPSLSVVVICLGAQLLSISASPVTLPVIAAIVAVTLPATELIARGLASREMPSAEVTLARSAIEASALLTGALAVAVALWRDAAGLPTAVAVLVILAVGAGVAAVTTRRVLFWWIAGVSATGALWAVWRILDIDLLEPYVLPPALAAVVVGVVVLLRGGRGGPLVAGGLGVAIAPSLVAFGLDGGSARVIGLLTTSALLCLVARLIVIRARTADAVPRLVPARVPMLIAATLAATAGPLLGVRIGVGWATTPAGILPVWAAALAAVVGACLAGIAGVLLATRPSKRGEERAAASSHAQWVLVPATISLPAGMWAAIAEDWPTIWTMWALMLVLLIGVVAVAARLRRGRTGILPPVWLLFALSFVTAVVAWSPRHLRVEWFSLPLGIALLLAGALHLSRATAPDPGTLASWPLRWAGSWALLAPGIATIMSASIVATFTDPLTWRAILVIVMALIAILVGARWRLAAPFLIGIAVLPVENISAFAVQIGRGIESMPWWITLAVVGAVLLIIAVSYERRSEDAEGLGARVRDLR